MTWEPPDADDWREPTPADWLAFARRHMGHWILERDHSLRQVDLLTWAQWFETAERHVGDWSNDDYRVSTVFLGIDHSWVPVGPPILFETMVFARGSDWATVDGWMRRYATWDQAVEGHRATVQALMRGALDSDDSINPFG